MLARMFRWGEGVPRSYARADSLYERACNLGLSRGCEDGMELNDPSSTGRRNIIRFAVFAEKACEGGNGDACVRIGVLYDVGLGVPKDTARANKLFKMGCAFENQRACGMVRR